MQHRPAVGTVKTPVSNFTGDVYLDSVFAGEPSSHLVVGLVRFTPGARTNWHSHANGQLLVCTDGAGLVADRAGTVLDLRAGESVWTPPGEEHWHGGRAGQMMCHYAILEETEAGNATTWLEPVTDEQYRTANDAVTPPSRPQR